ncbi:MAG: hypothetical protein JO061_07765, partial [Acidobacteriaceae bacterium]|nr:hypothetical protein [Acidobacteriaceae bacterium]
MRLFLLFMPAVLFAQGITVTPANPAASVGSSITISTDRPALFTLSGAGSISTSYGNSTVYSAPASITPQHVMNGCMVLPSDSVYNTRIDQLPVHASSASWTPWMTSSYGLLLSYQWGTNVIDSSTPLAPQFFHYSGQLNGTGFPALPLSNRKRETGSYAMDGNNDHHVLSINRQTCQFYETYQDGVAVAGCPRCTAASGWTYSSSAYQQPGAGDGGGTTDAAGLPLAPLTVHLSEI